MQLLEFDTEGICSISSLLRQGIVGYANDTPTPRGISTVWLFLTDNSVLKIYTRMHDTVGWNEVGTLVFRLVGKDENVPKIVPLPQAWRDIAGIEKMLVVDDDFTAESGLQVSNDLGEVFTIVCSANVYQIEVLAPFFHRGFLPEYEMSHYKYMLLQ